MNVFLDIPFDVGRKRDPKCTLPTFNFSLYIRTTSRRAGGSSALPIAHFLLPLFRSPLEPFASHQLVITHSPDVEFHVTVLVSKTCASGARLATVGCDTRLGAAFVDLLRLPSHEAATTRCFGPVVVKFHEHSESGILAMCFRLSAKVMQ